MLLRKYGDRKLINSGGHMTQPLERATERVLPCNMASCSLNVQTSRKDSFILSHQCTCNELLWPIKSSVDV